ncbi:MAG TPA: hypothetical protein VKA34_06890 [Balneolales bacterium]|nr:hypothetical protein [Balneolales bacterium]
MESNLLQQEKSSQNNTQRLLLYRNQAGFLKGSGASGVAFPKGLWERGSS